MELELFNPFENLYFEDTVCFLTGVDLNKEGAHVSVFSDWVLDKFELRNKYFKLIDTSHVLKYNDMKLPCSHQTKEAYELLEKKIEHAFESGVSAMKALDEQELFLWMGKIVYGILYFDLKFEQEKQRKLNSELNLSPHLVDRFAKFHLMLQSLVSPIKFRTGNPWSIAIVPLKYSKDVFNYRDDAVNLLFSLGTNGFGLIACLQDNGININEHQKIIQNIGETQLHPIQFEELVGRFMYSNYLLQYKPTYTFSEQNNCLIIDSHPIVATEKRPLFGTWEDKMFGQVLAGLWKPWGITEKEIVSDSRSPISYLQNERTLEFIKPEEISLPF